MKITEAEDAVENEEEDYEGEAVDRQLVAQYLLELR